MAAFLSNQSPLVSSPSSTSFSSSSSSSNPFHTLHLPPITVTLLPISHPYLPRPTLGFSPHSSSFNRRSLFKFHLASQDSLPTINDETKDTQNDVIRDADDDEDRKSLPSLMALLEAYKEAILNGDEKTVSWIEVRIQSFANIKAELIEKVSTLSAEKVASKEKCLRLQADFDNFRKRIEKERLGIHSDAREDIIEKLLLMVDNFERTKQQNKAATEKEKKIDASYQGIYKQFVEIMRSHNVSVIATVGKPFNPLLHEAVAREESQEFKEGIIIKESRRGFLLRDQVLRPALVKVSLGPGNKKSTVAPDKSKEQPSAAAGVDER